MALMNTLTDKFLGTTLDSTKWRQGGIGVTVNNKLYVNLGKGGGNNQAYAWSGTGAVNTYYDITANYVYINVTWQTDNPEMRLQSSSGHTIRVKFNSTGFAVAVQDANGLQNFTYSGGVMNNTYVRVSNTSGNNYTVDTSLDASSWTTRVSFTSIISKSQYLLLGAMNQYTADGMTVQSVNMTVENHYTQEVYGAIGMSGTLDPKATFSRSIDADMRLSADLEYTKIMDTSVPEKKLYLAKVYSPDDTFLGVINDIHEDPSWSEEINSAGSAIDLELNRNSDSLIIDYEPMLDSDGNEILDDAGNPIMTSRENRNKIGLGSLIAHGNRVDVWLFYKNAPNGIRKLSGFINEIGTRYGGSETTVIQLMTYGYDLDQYLVETDTGETTVPNLSYDPAMMIREHLDDLPTRSGGETYTTYVPEVYTQVTNLVKNPNFDSGSYNWTASATGIFLGATSAQFYSSPWSLVIELDGSMYTGYKYAQTPAGTSGIPCTPGASYTLQAQTRANVANTVPQDIGIVWYTNTGTTIGANFSTTTIYSHTEWTLKSVTLTAPANAVFMAVALGRNQAGNTANNALKVYYDDVMLEAGSTMTPYFDGDKADAGNVVYSWTGTTKNSTSTKRTYSQYSSVELTNSVVSYTWRAQTYKEMLDKVVSLSPAGWYYRIGLGDNTVYFKKKSDTPNHVFRLGKHIEELDMRSYSANVKNDVLFFGQETAGVRLYRRRTIAPVEGTRRGLSRQSDNRVSVTSSADILTQGEIDEKKNIQFRCTVKILAADYDTETINVGESVGWDNFDNYVDDLVLQIVGMKYEADGVTLQLDTLPPSPSKRLEDLRRNLNEQENENVPNAPVEV